MGTSVELVEGWRVKRIQQIREIRPRQVAVGANTEKWELRCDDTKVAEIICMFVLSLIKHAQQKKFKNDS